jgi:hypothetical protein
MMPEQFMPRRLCDYAVYGVGCDGINVEHVVLLCIVREMGVGAT